MITDHAFRTHQKTGGGHLCTYMNCRLPRDAHARVRAARGRRRAKARPS